jgi:ketol-acid reductoisomerase
LNSYIAEYLKSHPFENTTEYSEILKSEKYVLLETEIKDLKQKLESGEKVKTKLDDKIREQKRLFKSASKKHSSNIESTLKKKMPETELEHI